MKHLKAIYQNIILPFAVLTYGFIVPVFIGFSLSMAFEMPRLMVMLMIFGLAVLLYIDLIKSYDKKRT